MRRFDGYPRAPQRLVTLDGIARLRAVPRTSNDYTRAAKDPSVGHVTGKDPKRSRSHCSRCTRSRFGASRGDLERPARRGPQPARAPSLSRKHLEALSRPRRLTPGGMIAASRVRGRPEAMNRRSALESGVLAADHPVKTTGGFGDPLAGDEFAHCCSRTAGSNGLVMRRSMCVLGGRLPFPAVTKAPAMHPERLHSPSSE